MKKAYIFAEVVEHPAVNQRYYDGRTFWPGGGNAWMRYPHRVSVFCGLDNFKLWLKRSLDRVNSLLDESKPGGAKVLFRGVFFFFFSFCNYGYRLFAFPFLLAILMVQVKSLHKSRQPFEHGLNLLDQIGKIIQLEVDGEYSLIEFQNLRILSKDKKTRIPLQWYVHKSDYAQTGN